jgi:hypothetical protein
MKDLLYAWVTLGCRSPIRSEVKCFRHRHAILQFTGFESCFEITGKKWDRQSDGGSRFPRREYSSSQKWVIKNWSKNKSTLIRGCWPLNGVHPPTGRFLACDYKESSPICVSLKGILLWHWRRLCN